ncbi:MAG: flagellar biosynthetic protein FliQ [Pseudomonadota bacterium]
MTATDALDITQFAIWTTIVASSPPVIAAMLVGLVIALVQALTQIQEITLTFIPKIVAIFITLIVFAPFIGSQIGRLADVTYARIETGF